jgi:hypothetical protein
MSNEIRELIDAELDAVSGGGILGDIAQGIANIANGTGGGGSTSSAGLGMRKAGGNSDSAGLYFL